MFEWIIDKTNKFTRTQDTRSFVQSVHKNCSSKEKEKAVLQNQKICSEPNTISYFSNLMNVSWVQNILFCA